MDSKKSVCRSRSCTFRRFFFNRKGGGGARDKRREALGHVFYRYEREEKKKSRPIVHRTTCGTHKLAARQQKLTAG